MNRRDFLRRLTVGGVAAATAAQEWPFRVFSFPKEIKIAPIAIPPQTRVRFIRAFDPAQAKMVNRWDVLYGFMKTEDPRLGPFMAHVNTFDVEEFKLASPEEARKLGLIDPRYAEAMDDVCGKEDCEFETTAIAPPQRFIERYELTEKDEENWPRLPLLTGKE